MGTMVFRKVRSVARSDDDAIQITLFRDERGRVCAWYIGPIRIRDGKFHVPYLPRSERARASLAVVRALDEIEEAGGAICIVDPDDLWEPAWATDQT